MAGQDVSALSFSTVEELYKFINTGEVEFVDCCFVEPLGVWNHCTFDASYCSADDFATGFAFDGSSIRLFTEVNNSDMLMKPDVTRCWVDPFCRRITIHINCDVTACDGKPYPRCPRHIARSTANYIKTLGIADEMFFGPEPEFFIFDNVQYSVNPHHSIVKLDSVEGRWGSGLEGSNPFNSKFATANLGHTNGPKGYYMPVAPQDTGVELRAEMLSTLKRIGIQVEKHHHEVATSQHELGIRCGDLLTTADNVMAYKYVVKNVAKLYGKSATFMPKPFHDDNGSGMHVHQSLWKKGVNLFYDANSSYHYLSKTALYYIGGLLHHAPSILAFSNPTVNSYKRLRPGFEAPASLVYSANNRSAAVRIPSIVIRPEKTARVEFRCPDPAACPHIAFAAMALAGVDGIVNQILPQSPKDLDFFRLTEEQRKTIQPTPSSLEGALNALENDHEFLTRSGAFTDDFLSSYISFKRREVSDVTSIPSPKEFEAYYNC